MTYFSDCVANISLLNGIQWILGYIQCLSHCAFATLRKIVFKMLMRLNVYKIIYHHQEKGSNFDDSLKKMITKKAHNFSCKQCPWDSLITAYRHESETAKISFIGDHIYEHEVELHSTVDIVQTRLTNANHAVIFTRAIIDQSLYENTRNVFPAHREREEKQI